MSTICLGKLNGGSLDIIDDCLLQLIWVLFQVNGLFGSVANWWALTPETLQGRTTASRWCITGLFQLLCKACNEEESWATRTAFRSTNAGLCNQLEITGYLPAELWLQHKLGEVNCIIKWEAGFTYTCSVNPCCRHSMALTIAANGLLQKCKPACRSIQA